MKKEIILCNVFFILCMQAACEKQSEKKESWRDKDIRDMNDADFEHLLEEWEKNDEPLEPDELPEHLRPSPKIDISKLDTSNPDNILKMTKKGKGVMMFVDTVEGLSPEQADLTMRIWQTSLQNNHIIAERYPIDTHRSIFMFREGSQAVDGKQFFLQQAELSHVTLEGQTYYRDTQKQNEHKAQMRKARGMEDSTAKEKKASKKRTEL